MKGVFYMNNKQLQYAIALSKTLNFSQVAEQLGISQPALSKQILNLEKDLGVELFDRKQTPLALTPAGEYFFHHAQDLIYREEQLYKSMEDFKMFKKGSLHIGISPFRSLYLMPSLCKKVKEKFPDVKIILHEFSSDILRANVADGKYDFAIINLPVNESILDITPIKQDQLVLVVPENLVPLIECPSIKTMEHIDFKYCKNLPFIVVSQSQEMRLLFEKICSMSNIEPKIAMEVVGLTTAWTMAQSGIGATLLPLQFIESVDSSDKLKLFIPNHKANVRQPAIITRRGQYISPYAQYAMDILTNKKIDD